MTRFPGCPMSLMPMRCLLAVGGILILALPLDAQSLADRILPLAEAHDGEVSLAVKDLSGDQPPLRHHADRPMPTASLIKLPLMIAAYQKVQNGELDLGQSIRLRESDQVPGSGILTPHFSPGTRISLRDAIHLMMVYSDNTATNLVIDQVGLPVVAELMNAWECPNTKLHSKVYRGDTSIFPERSAEFGLGSTTADEIVKLLERLYRRELISEQASEQMLEHLLACESRDKIPRLLPPDTKVAHKTGAIASVRCDAGIVFGPRGKAFAICILTRKNEDQRWTDDNAANRLCGEIAREAYDHLFDAPTDNSDVTPVLRIGAGGRLVEALQRTLNARLEPSPEIAVDGDFGPNTRKTVIDFQRSQGLEASGEVDEATWSALGTLIFEDQPVPPPDQVNAAIIEKAPADTLDGPPHVTCKSWAIGDAETGQLSWGSEVEKPLPMASTTKIMTAHVVLQLADTDPRVLNETVTFSDRADQTKGSTCGLRQGEQVSVADLLYGLLLPSGNDASVALAEHFGPRLGDEADGGADGDPIQRFVSAMNLTARELGMKDTQFRNTHGLTEPGHHSTAADLLMLASEAWKNTHFRKYVGTLQRGCTVTGPGGYQRHVRWQNTNRLLKINGYGGVKTGTTSAAGACLVSQGTHNGDSLIVVVLGSASSDARYADTRNLFRWGFSNLIHLPE